MTVLDIIVKVADAMLHLPPPAISPKSPAIIPNGVNPPPLAVADEAIDLIITLEDTDEAYYNRQYRHFDWPGGASGPTIGIGYDCGYCSKAEIAADWKGLVSPETIVILQEASGLTGGAARDWVRGNKGRVTIEWAVAVKQFRERELAKWINRVNLSLPNCDKLSPKSFGALVSLAYNRGCSFHKQGERYAEMVAIDVAMAKQNYSAIPDLILAMRRLWPDTPGLQVRRKKEAELFRSGLVPA